MLIKRTARVVQYIFYILLLATGAHAQITNPTSVTFESPDHATATSYEIDFVSAGNEIVKTIQVDKGSQDAAGVVTVTFPAQQLVSGSYTVRMRTIVVVGDTTLKSVDSAPSDTFVIETDIQAPHPPQSVHAVGADKLLTPADLVYEGAFRVPDGQLGASNFAYGGVGLSFYKEHNSLFIVGHDWNQNVAEISIPEIRKDVPLLSLDTATLLQPFAEATEGLRFQISPSYQEAIKIGGTLPYAGKLYLTAYIYYDANGTATTSHFSSGLDLSVIGDATGPWRMGTGQAGRYAGYFGLIPKPWQKALGGPVLNGQCCLSIVSRSSYGPAAFAIDPTQIGTVDPIPAVPLLYYIQSHQLDDYASTSTLYNGTTQIGGVAFPEGSRSVLFFGKQGIGKFDYCEGTSDPALDGVPSALGAHWCYDPVAPPAKGEHAYPYRTQVWAYDAADLAKAAKGDIAPWDIKPYAVWTLTLPIGSGYSRILGVAYDATTHRIFLSQEYGERELPLIHVFKVS